MFNSLPVATERAAWSYRIKYSHRRAKLLTLVRVCTRREQVQAGFVPSRLEERKSSLSQRFRRRESGR
jgi:hypothetical protein